MTSSSKRFRRPAMRAVTVACAFLAVAGCGSDESPASDVSVATSATDVAPESTATAPTTVAPVATTDDAVETSDGTATVTHEYGTVEIPLEPTRVLALENRRDLETAVVLDLPLLGVGIYGGGSDDVAAPFVPIDMEGIEIIDNAELNLEQIAAMAPDLILAREIHLNDGVADQLVRIAPILPIAAEGSWRTDLEQLADWLDRTELLDEALAEYDALLADVTERHADRLATPVAIVEYYPTDETFYAGGIDDFQLQANTLGELGGTLVPFLADRSYFDEPFSMENVGELADAGAILLVTSSEADRDDLASNPLWQQLPAVAEGNVVFTDTRTNQGSVYAATESVRLLDELYATMGN